MMEILKEAFSSWTALDVVIYVIAPFIVGLVMGKCK